MADTSLIDHFFSLKYSMAMEVTRADNGVNTLDDNMNEYVDIISFNQYVGWYRNTLEEARTMKWVIPYDKPVIISEFGGGAQAGLHGDVNARFTEEYQEELYIRNLEMLDKMGVDAAIRDNTLFVEGHSLAQRLLTGTLLKGGRYSSHHDHRMVMALKVAELGADGPFEIDDTECVSKSFPTFFELFDRLQTK